MRFQRKAFEAQLPKAAKSDAQAEADELQPVHDRLRDEIPEVLDRVVAALDALDDATAEALQTTTHLGRARTRLSELERQFGCSVDDAMASAIDRIDSTAVSEDANIMRRAIEVHSRATERLGAAKKYASSYGAAPAEVVR